MMAKAPVLPLPDFSEPFALETDACNYGIGAMLMQRKKPIGYFIKAFCPRNQGLSVYEKKLLAITSVMDKWRHYLEAKTFIIKTNHFSFKYLLQQKLQTHLQKKSLTMLLGLSYTIHYQKGQENKVADVLSRLPEPAKAKLNAISRTHPEWVDELVASYKNDQQVQDIIISALKGIPDYQY